MAPGCIVFDLDGVLCHYHLPTRLARLAELCGRAPTTIEAAVWGSGFENRADAGELDAEHYLAEFGRRIGAPLTRAEWIAARGASMRLDLPMLDLVVTLSRRVEVGMLSNNGWLLRESLDELAPELVTLFGRRLFVSAEMGAIKPDPLVFRRMAERLGRAPQELLLVDDNAANVSGAITAGWAGHHFQGGDPLREYLAGIGLGVTNPTTADVEANR